MTNDKQFILIVIPDESMRKVLLEAFQDHGCPFHYEIVPTAQEARKLLSQRKIQAVIMTKSIALSGDEGTDRLISSQAGLPPTITILQQGDGYPNYLYNTLKINDWITVPFELQEFYNRVFSVISRAKEPKMTKISTKIQLIATLQDTNQRVINWFTEIPAKDFFTRHGEVWSASDNVDHLIKSHKPLAKALRLPKITLQAMFGKPQKSSMPYEELCQIYRDEIAKGAQASGRYLPNQENPAAEGGEEKKKDLLEQFSKASAELVSAVEKWDENELDQYQLPHPILGKLTIQELLFFTIYHNLRHASQEGD
jgi:DNA-binding response OmpR family regulator